MKWIVLGITSVVLLLSSSNASAQPTCGSCYSQANSSQNSLNTWHSQVHAQIETDKYFCDSDASNLYNTCWSGPPWACESACWYDPSMGTCRLSFPWLPEVGLCEAHYNDDITSTDATYNHYS